MEAKNKSEVQNSKIKLRDDPKRRKDRVFVGCGAGFGGDRPIAALKLLQKAKQLDYLVLECLAERTLADRYQLMAAGGKGYDPRITQWLSLLLPLAVERGVCIITNMGAMDPLGAQKETLEVARNLGINITVSIAYEVFLEDSGSSSLSKGCNKVEGGVSTYLGAAPIVQCLERYRPHVIITSRVADAALFLAPMINFFKGTHLSSEFWAGDLVLEQMVQDKLDLHNYMTARVYELGWNWNDFQLLAQGALAGHLLECGCQLTGGYFMHPGDKYRDFSYEQLLDVSLPFAEVSYQGEICLAKTDFSGGVLNHNTCAEQLLYEIGDPGSYITPDVVIDLQDVQFCPLSNDRVLCSGARPSIAHFPDKLLRLIPKACGWKGWGEISYGGYGCVRRAEAADFLVRSWMEEVCPGIKDCIVSYIIGHDSLKVANVANNNLSVDQILDVRLRMDGLFQLKEHAVCFIEEFIALYTNGPAGGGGISTGHKKEIILQRELVEREHAFWQTDMKKTEIMPPSNAQLVRELKEPKSILKSRPMERTTRVLPSVAAPSGKKIPLYEIAHSRAGDKGNDLNFSVIPHFPQDVARLKMVITPTWVKNVVSVLLNFLVPDPEANKRRNDQLEQVTVEIYEVKGIHSLNVVVRNILDGGVNCSRRIDRHGKTVSDLILCQEIVLPP